MDELEILKQDWKKNENSFKQVGEKEIYNMIHKSSTSVVKWILIISILEFVILNGISFLISDKEIENFERLHPYIGIIEKVNYVVILGFIYLFNKNYKSISILSSSKKLIKDILQTRKTVNYYIYWNLIVGCFTGAIGFFDGFTKGNGLESENNIAFTQIESILIFCFGFALIFALIYGFYKLLYGFLMRRLQKNYNELSKIDF